MNEELEVLRKVVELLKAAKLPFFLSGSLALNYYTEPRMTRDIDIVIKFSEVEIEVFYNLFKKEFYTDKKMIEDEVKRKRMFNLIHNEFIIKVDFIIAKDTEFQQSMFERVNEVTIDNFSVPLISPEDLVIMKMQWAKESRSEIQLRDIRQLLKVTGSLDSGYIEIWINKLGLQKIYQETVNQ